MPATPTRRAVAVALAAASCFVLTAVPRRAQATATGVFAGQTMAGAPTPCVDHESGVRVCHGTSNTNGLDLRLESFDGVPLSFYVTLPAAPVSGIDGGYPLVVQSHGWGLPPRGPDDRQYGGPSAIQFASKGYAVLQLAARGWGDSCGTPESRMVDPVACAKGYVRLDDSRYEARDVQNAVGLLVDAGLVDPDRVGAMGESYGAGVSLELATLNDRVMNPDGSLSPWTSPAGTPLHLAAAAPFAGWSDLVYSLAPNGRTLDSEITSVTADLDVIGVEKQSIVSGLYAVGTMGAYYAAAGTDPEADVTTWFARTSAGEPYGRPGDDEMVRRIAQYRSPYYLLAGAYGMEQAPPAPLFMANGFTDDVFPADELLRYYNLHRELYPSLPISLLFYDGGHQRGSNRAIDVDRVRLSDRIEAFIDHYVMGTGPAPELGVTAVTQTCQADVPATVHQAATWAALHPGEVTFTSEEPQTVLSSGGDPSIARSFDPVAGGLACTTTAGGDQGLGVATYRLPTVTGEGYTLLGAPTVTADLAAVGPHAYVAARLLDVDTATDTQTLISRGVYRIDPDGPVGRITFQLHANGWHFAAGHVPKLELLGQDAPYLRPSNVPFQVTVSNLRLQLPVA